MVKLGFPVYQLLKVSFNAKSSLYICTNYIGFAFNRINGISTIVGYFMPNTPYTIRFYGLSSIVDYLMPNPFIHIYRIHRIWFDNFMPNPLYTYCPIGWGCRIHRLHLCRGVRLLNECLGYDTKQSDGVVSVMLGLWWIRSTPSLLLLPGPLWPGVVAPDRVLFMGYIELTANLC